jgi:chromate transporter
VKSLQAIIQSARIKSSNSSECTCRSLFFTFLKIGAFTFGGGYAMIPLIQKEIVQEMCWMDDQECVNIIGVTQVAPGAVAINTAIYIGYELKGILGALAATLGIVLPSFVTITLIAILFSQLQDHPIVQAFFSGVRPGIAAMIGYAALRMSDHVLRDSFSKGLTAAVLAAILFLHVHPIAAIVGGGIAGVIHTRFFNGDIQ